MNIQTLIKMANQIGTFFEPEVALEVAADDTANHIHRFWDPRMRRALIAHVDANGDAELLAVVAAALTRHRDTLLGSVTQHLEAA
ncbi:MAG: formate dehydrogenase subunit delta [Azoarcus sp.]|nr:formate dehydrogenase subunit delta [Azoarcus sp.]